MAYDQIDVAIIAANPWIRTVVHERVVTSTNTLVAQLVASGSCELPLLMLADEQTEGRGRGSNRWWSSPGSITLSLAVGRTELTISPRSIYSLAVAVAVREALSADIAPERLALKWPNDVMLDERKVAGILLETAGPMASVLVVGIGINANNDCNAAPPEMRQRATSIADTLQRPIGLTPLIVGLISTLQSAFTNRTTGAELLARYRRADYLAGKRIQVLREGECLIGDGAGIDDAGSLLVATDSGSISISSGTVEIIPIE